MNFIEMELGGLAIGYSLQKACSGAAVFNLPSSQVSITTHKVCNCIGTLRTRQSRGKAGVTP